MDWSSCSINSLSKDLIPLKQFLATLRKDVATTGNSTGGTRGLLGVRDKGQVLVMITHLL